MSLLLLLLLLLLSLSLYFESKMFIFPQFRPHAWWYQSKLVTTVEESETFLARHSFLECCPASSINAPQCFQIHLPSKSFIDNISQAYQKIPPPIKIEREKEEKRIFRGPYDSIFSLPRFITYQFRWIIVFRMDRWFRHFTREGNVYLFFFFLSLNISTRHNRWGLYNGYLHELDLENKKNKRTTTDNFGGYIIPFNR